MNLNKISLAVISFLLLSLSTPAQCLPKKGDKITLKIPGVVFGVGKVSRWNGKTTLKAEVTGGTGTLAINGKSDWQSAGWPLMLTLKVQKVSQGKNGTELEAQVPDQYPAKAFALRFAASANVDAVVFCGTAEEFEKSDYYAKEVADRFGRLLSEKLQLPHLTRDQTITLAQLADYQIDSITVNEYKGQRYATFSLESSHEYNSIQLGQAARAARVIQDSFLTELKLGYYGLKDVPRLNGIRIDMEVPYRDFVSEYVSHHDSLTLYSAFEDLKKFADADITSQELIDRSTVLINSNRVKVSLDTAK
jgi:hypothetical protein